MAEPFPKSAQLSRGPKRPARIKANREEWLKLREQKLRLCRCFKYGRCGGGLELHHLVPRSMLGDDVADNLVPLCSLHHQRVTENRSDSSRQLAQSLTDAEYAYCIEKLGEGAMERLFGVLGVAAVSEETP